MSMYLLLYSGGRMPVGEDGMTAMVEAWGPWLADLGEDLVDGNPFTANAKTVSADGSLSDGPVGPMPSGYSMVKAASMDAAAEIARGCPATLSGASISILEVA